jgi:predicted TPR repeat methyltransferase
MESVKSAVPAEDVVERALDLLARGRPGDAQGLLETLIAGARGGLFAKLTLVRARLATHDIDRAIALARETAFENAHVADAALALGETLERGESLPLAIAEFQRALRLDANLDAARVALGRAWLAAGEPERALEVLDGLCGSESAGLRERAGRMRAQNRSDAGYVRHLFDQFSADYDLRMRTTLAYAVPEILVSLARLVLAKARDLEILDLGCGTGLAGEAFRDRSKRLCGVDLSPKMMAGARNKGIYDALICGDIESVREGSLFDLAIAADTLVYLGDFSAVLDNVCAQLKPEGFFLFTVERSDEPEYALGPKRRWRHSEAYLRRAAADHGFELAGLLSCTPRIEAGEAVAGLACALQKRA